MFDNLRDNAELSNFYEEEPAKYQPPATSTASGSSKRLFGLTSFQRFIVSFLILISVCVIGMLFLLITNKVGF